jgi:hypothetical protein
VTSRIIDVTYLFSMSRELTARITACHDECRNPCKGGANLTYHTHTHSTACGIGLNEQGCYHPTSLVFLTGSLDDFPYIFRRCDQALTKIPCTVYIQDSALKVQ